MPSNNNPTQGVKRFLDALSENIPCCIPRMIRSDCGKENVLLCAIQCYMRRNHNDSYSGSFIYGTSHANQRQEAWWSFYRRTNSFWIIDFFKEMVDDDLYHPNDALELACARFVFGPLVKRNLNEIAELWNNNYIRRSPVRESPSLMRFSLFYLLLTSCI